jgi:hypothetical protein
MVERATAMAGDLPRVVSAPPNLWLARQKTLTDEPRASAQGGPANRWSDFPLAALIRPRMIDLLLHRTPNAPEIGRA